MMEEEMKIIEEDFSEDFLNVELETKELISFCLQTEKKIQKFNESKCCQIGACQKGPGLFGSLGKCSYCGNCYCSSHSGGASKSIEPQLFSKDGIHEDKDPTCCSICKQINNLKLSKCASIFIIGNSGAGKTCKIYFN
jgi:hypothetical protein